MDKGDKFSQWSNNSDTTIEFDLSGNNNINSVYIYIKILFMCVEGVLLIIIAYACKLSTTTNYFCNM